MRNLILACMLAASATQGDIVVQQEDPWNYDSRLAPEGISLLGAYNGHTVVYKRVIRSDSRGWNHEESPSGGYDDRHCGIPDAWMRIPTPQKFPKLVEGKTKEQVEQMLKEFDK